VATFREAVRSASRAYLIAALRATRGNVARASKRAGMNRTSFYRLLDRFDVRHADAGVCSPGRGRPKGGA